MQKMMRQAAERLAEELAVQCLDSGILVGFTKRLVPVLFVDRLHPLLPYGIVCRYRLSSASETAARARHYFDECVG